MATYKCNNTECPEYNQEKRINLHLTFGKGGVVTDNNEICPACGSVREKLIEDNGLCTTTKGRPNVPNN